MLQKIKRKKQASKMLGETDSPGFSWPSVTKERIKCKVQSKQWCPRRIQLRTGYTPNNSQTTTKCNKANNATL